MKIYLASSFKLKDRVEEVAEELKDAGHEITREWWHDNYKEIVDLPLDEWYEHEDVEWVCQENLGAVEEADVFVLVAPQWNSKKFNGANIEFGYALAKGKDCYSLGSLEQSGMYQPIERLDVVEQLIMELEE